MNTKLVHRSSSYSTYEDAHDFLLRIVRREGQKSEAQILRLFKNNSRLVDSQLSNWESEGLVKGKEKEKPSREVSINIPSTISALYKLQTIRRNGKEIVIARDKQGRFVKRIE